MDRYLEGDELKEDELLADLLTAILHGRFHPVIPINSLNGIGTDQLLTVIENSFPQPGTHRLRVAAPNGKELESLSGDPTGLSSPRSSAPRRTSSRAACRSYGSTTAR
jgi:elongation factor G